MCTPIKTLSFFYPARPHRFGIPILSSNKPHLLSYFASPFFSPLRLWSRLQCVRSLWRGKRSIKRHPPAAANQIEFRGLTGLGSTLRDIERSRTLAASVVLFGRWTSRGGVSLNRPFATLKGCIQSSNHQNRQTQGEKHPHPQDTNFSKEHCHVMI